MTFSNQDKTIDYIFSWYEDQSTAMRRYKIDLRASVIAPPILDTKFFGFTLQDIEDYFLESKKELEHLVCFDLISATESALRIDFYTKISDRKRLDITKDFKQIQREKEDRVSLEQDIIEKWKEHYPAEKKYFSALLGLLKYRHWLAHGRYWVPKLGHDYDVQETYDIVENIIDTLKSNP